MLSGALELKKHWSTKTPDAFQTMLQEGDYTGAADTHETLRTQGSSKTSDSYDHYCRSTAYQPESSSKDKHIGGQPHFEEAYSTLHEVFQSRGTVSVEDVVAANKVITTDSSGHACLRGSPPCHNIGGMPSHSPPFCPGRPQFIPVSPKQAALLESNPLLTYTPQTCTQPLNQELPEGHTLAHVWFASPYHVQKLLHNWVAEFNKAIKSGADGLPRLLELEAEFIAIHPFTDGNGRTARTLTSLALRTIGLPCVPSMVDTLILTQTERQQYYHQRAAGTYNALYKSIADGIERHASPKTGTAETVEELLPAIAAFGSATGIRRRRRAPEPKTQESKKTQ